MKAISCKVKNKVRKVCVIMVCILLMDKMYFRRNLLEKKT